MEALRRCHANYFLALAEEAEPRLTGAEQGVWLDLLEAERDDLRAAIGWTIKAGEPEMELRFAGALSWFCYLCGYYGEGREWLEGAPARGKASTAPLRAKALLQESLGLYRDVGDRWRAASVLEGLAEVACDRGKHERATRLFGSGEALRECIGTPLPPCERADYDRGVAAARAGLDEAVLAAAWAERRAMTLEQAIEYAFSEEGQQTAAPAPATLTAPASSSFKSFVPPLCGRCLIAESRTRARAGSHRGRSRVHASFGPIGCRLSVEGGFQTDGEEG